jgi:hypothetical protein
MPVAIKGALAVRKALREFEPELAKATTKEITQFMRPVVAKAKGYVPSEAPLSGWENAVGLWANRVFNPSIIKQGIKASTAPTKANRSGFRSIATIYNKSAAGAIYETAGRKSGADGRPQAPSVQHYANAGTPFARPDYMVRSSDKAFSQSANPNAGKQFIGAMGKIYEAQRAAGQRGRTGRKFNGRLIFRAFGEDSGRAQARIAKAVEASAAKLQAKVGA